MDEDDEFLYGDSKPVQAAEQSHNIPGLTSGVSLEKTSSSNGVVSHFEDDPEETVDMGDEDAESEPNEQADAEESEDEIEIIMEPTARSLDFRQGAPSRPPANRAASSSTYTTPMKAAQPSLTTEYTPHERGGLGTPKAASQQHSSAPFPALSSSHQGQTHTQDPANAEDGPDPSTLPPVTAPPSHPSINLNATGMLDGRSILEVDIAAMAEKPWRRPGSDISDWFNYGFDEISWEAYCYRRRDLGDTGAALKTNVLNFAGMPEDQLSALPPEVRQMVMTGATTMMSTAGPNPMMGPAVGMNPMMDMSGMGPMGAMNMGPMGMGMNGDMNMQMQPGGPMMQDVQLPGPGVPGGPSTTPEQGVQMGMPDGFGPGGPGPGMIPMGMGGDFGMQEQSQMGPVGQTMYPGMEGNVAPSPGGRGGTPAPYRGRGMAQLRGRGGFQGRGRGRGMYAVADGVPPPLPVRPASPLPPGVPTGPRNQNKYKDRDGNAPAVEGLDYGGTNKDSGGRTPSGEPEDRSGSRKRRSSPGLDDGRGSKRR